jgi:hypothetical protein
MEYQKITFNTKTRNTYLRGRLSTGKLLFKLTISLLAVDARGSVNYAKPFLSTRVPWRKC